MQNLILGVEIGGTKLQLAVGTPSGDILMTVKGQVDVTKGGEGIRQWLKLHIPKLIASAELRYGGVVAIGCGFGGPISRQAGKVLKSIQIDGWQNFLIRDWFHETFSLPTTVENDSNAATWGEYLQGFGRGTQHFFYTNIGSGVGGGFVFNGRLYDGQGYGAGEFGHTYVPDWTADQPGQAKVIEDLCSGWAIENRLRKPGYVPESSELYQRFLGDLSKITPIDLAESARNGDVFALSEIDRVAFSMGLGLANVLSLTNVERIAIGGGVAKMGKLLLEPIRNYTNLHEFVSNHQRYEIQLCELGDHVVLIGAILIAKEAFAIL
jgi:glucokinase